jgi:hypothetical protein
LGVFRLAHPPRHPEGQFGKSTLRSADIAQIMIWWERGTLRDGAEIFGSEFRAFRVMEFPRFV